MLRFLLKSACAAILAIGAMTPHQAAAVNGNSLALRSNGAISGTGWVLNDDGYVGTYINVPIAGDVTISVNASGVASSGVAPHMNIAVGDSVAGWDVSPTTTTYQQTFSLPAGTHFIRTEFTNDPQKTARSLNIGSLDVAGATINNTNSNSIALAAADNYIDKFRKGPAHLALAGVDPGAQVHVQLRRHDFRFGTAVGGTTLTGVNSFLNNANFSNFLLANFNTITEGNAGKWAYNEATRDVVTMSAVDRIFDYADQHGLDVRLHNMLWGDSQQPGRARC